MNLNRVKVVRSEKILAEITTFNEAMDNTRSNVIAMLLGKNLTKKNWEQNAINYIVSNESPQRSVLLPVHLVSFQNMNGISCFNSVVT